MWSGLCLFYSTGCQGVENTTRLKLFDFSPARDAAFTKENTQRINRWKQGRKSTHESFMNEFKSLTI